jgi:Transglycosylase SLT domain
MKIDFLGRYKELDRVIHHRPANSPEQSAAFTKLLRDVAPQRELSTATSGASTDSRARMGVEILSSQERSPQVSPQVPELPQARPSYGKVAQRYREAELPRSQPMEVGLHSPTTVDAALNMGVIETLLVERRSGSNTTPTDAIPLTVRPPVTALKKDPETSPKVGTVVEQSVKPQKEKSAPSKESIYGLIDQAGAKHGIDPALGKAVAHTESALRFDAVSKDGHNSKGIFQLKDPTGKDLLTRAGLTEAEYNPFDPELNTDLGMGYLRYLHEIFSDPVTLVHNTRTHKAGDLQSLERFAVAAYNAGEGRVASAQARAERAGLNPGDFAEVQRFLPASTRGYVKKVMSQRDELLE